MYPSGMPKGWANAASATASQPFLKTAPEVRYRTTLVQADIEHRGGAHRCQAHREEAIRRLY
jgi:hypothetical protein